MHQHFSIAAGSLLLTVLLSPVLCAGTEAEPVHEGKALSVWIKQLRSSEKVERRQAAEALGRLAGKTRSVAPALLAALRAGGEIHEEAINVLVRMGPAAVPALLQTLWSEDRDGRRLAIFILGRMGGAARPAIPSLLEMLDDKDAVIRVQAIHALGDMRAQEATAALLPLLRSDNAVVREHVLAALMDLHVEGKQIVSVLSKWLQEDDEKQRLLAALTLADLGSEAAPAVAALTDALRDDNTEVRVAAARSLGRIGPDARIAVDSLTEALKEERWRETRPIAAEALWRIARSQEAVRVMKAWLKEKHGLTANRPQAAGRLWWMDKSPEAVNVLAETLRKGSPEERMQALDMLIRIGPGAKSALPAATPLLQEKNLYLRFAAVVFLGRLGEHAGPARDELSKALEDDSSADRFAAAQALWRLDRDPKRIALLATFLQDRDAEVRRAAAEWLGWIGPAVRPAEPALAKALRSDDARVRLRSAVALWQLDQRRQALDALLAGLDDEDAAVRTEAASSLGFLLGREGRPAVAALQKHLWDEDSLVRSTAAEALGRIGPPAASAVPALMALLRGEEDDPIHSSAAEALGLIGKASKPAVPLLLARLKHPDRYVRVSAALALWHIEGNRAGLPVATAALRDRNPRVRVIAAELLGRADQTARAMATLLDVLREASLPDQAGGGNVRYMVARSLGRLGPAARDAVPELRALLDDEEDAVRVAARKALQRIDPEAVPRDRK